MERLIKLDARVVVISYMVIDIMCAAAGMGVPIFCILLGFPLGWYITKSMSMFTAHSYGTHYRVLRLSLLASAFTFVQMVVIWGRTIPMLFSPMSDFQNFGHPFILYDPKTSFIGWLILMILISPFLQLLTTIFASFMTLIRNEAKSSYSA